jgi:G3E family GTPase
MAKIDIISGFLGAGKTTLIKKLISDVFAGQKVVLIENEFGEIGIDGGFLKEAGIQITEMNSGCICCSLVGDFAEALKKVVDQFHPDHIIIEPSGVGKLSDIRSAIENTSKDCDLELGSLVTVADVKKVKMYMKNFGEFYNNQIESAGTIIFSRTQNAAQEKIDEAIAMIREKNPDATIITTPWDDLNGKTIHDAMEQSVSLADQLLAQMKEHAHDHEEDEHHHDHEDHDHEHHHDHEDHDHEHHHDHEDHDHEHHHDHDDHDHHHDHEDHEHAHQPDENGTVIYHSHDHAHGHHHHHHGGHDADEVFQSWGAESPRTYTDEEIAGILKTLSESTEEEYGVILRSKGMVPRADGTWIHFDMVPEETEIRTGAADYTGRIVVIGAGLKEDKIQKLFSL